MDSLNNREEIPNKIRKMSDKIDEKRRSREMSREDHNYNYKNDRDTNNA